MATHIRDDLLLIWRELLDNDDVQPGDDFTSWNGGSLFAMRVIGRVWDAFGIELSPGALFDHASVDALAEHITQRLTDSSAIA